MSAVLALFGANADAIAMLRRGALAAPGRGPIQAQWQGAQAAVVYQGNAAEQEFYVSRECVCVALGWPYAVDARGARRLFAADFAAQFARTSTLAVDAVFGQFVLFVLCLKSARLFVARDVLGGLPLHWCALAAGSLHATDIRQIAAATGQPLQLSLNALRQYHQSLSLPASRDLYQDIHLHAPGVVTVFQTNSHETLHAAPSLRALAPRFGTEPAPENATQQLIDVVTNSLTMAQQGNNAVFSLSGGMDSALLLLCGWRHNTQQNNSGDLFSASCVFPGLRCDESARINALQALVSTRHQDIVCRQPSFAHWQTELFAATDYVPFPANQIGLQIAKASAALGRSHVFDGNGGDELFDWSLLDLAQCVTSKRDWQQLLRALLQSGNGPRRAAVRHALKRLWHGRIDSTINAPLPLAQKMLSPSIDRAFYLAAEQIASSVGLSLYSPLRDRRLLQFFTPWLPQGSFAQAQRRGLQASAIVNLSGGSIRPQRAQKVNFDEFARVPLALENAPHLVHLGLGKLPDFAGLMPKFLQHKIDVEGILLSS
jgi:asparagine synthetase B (glutamine-hydrolysing)